MFHIHLGANQVFNLANLLLSGLIQHRLPGCAARAAALFSTDFLRSECVSELMRWASSIRSSNALSMSVVSASAR
ncbi:MAG: hypothetical protein WKG07_08530 [Hymenobacter sp.]